MTLNNYILPTLYEDQFGVVLLLIGSNDINNQTKDKINAEKLTEDFTKISKCWVAFGVKEVIISSISPKNNMVLTRLIRHLILSLIIIFQELI